MKTFRYASIAMGLALALGATQLWAQGGGGGSGAPSNNPPGAATNNAGNVQPGGKPAGQGTSSSTTPMKADSSGKAGDDNVVKRARPSRAPSAPTAGASSPK